MVLLICLYESIILCLFIVWYSILFEQYILFMVMLLLVLLITCSSSIILGNNLVSNSRFSQPDIISQGAYLSSFPNNIPGWSCTHMCQIDNCEQFIKFHIQLGLVFGNCKGQVLDISSYQIEVVTQIIQTTQGSHNLSVQYLIPKVYANLKILQIYFNGEMVYSYQPYVDCDYKIYLINLNIQAKRGRNNLTFTQSGMNDGIGFRLASVQFRRQINPQIQSFISNLFNNYATLGVVSIPGSRILFGGLVSSLVSFDRMQLYHYHNRNYSYYTNILLSNIATLMNSKGSLSLNIQEKILGNAAIKQQSFFQQFDYKYNYINTEVIRKSQSGYGFVANNINLLVYSIPLYVVSIAVLYLVFRLAFTYKISKLVRKYSFLGIIFLLMLCQGNIQQYSFYAFGEFRTFFSVNFNHKIANLIIAGFFFIVLISSLTLSFIIWGKHKKNSKYFVDNVDLCLGGMTAHTISNGLFCLLLGALHQLLLTTPNLQLLTLGITEFLWIILQMVFLSRKFYKIKWMVWRNIMEGLLRIAFQFMLYVYNNSEDQGGFINSQVHLIIQY